MKLFCIPYAGGTTSIYFEWKRLLPALNIVPIDLPGHGLNIKLPLLSSFDANKDFLFTTITERLDDGEDYCIFGHSLGGVLAYEICKTLESSKFPNPTRLFISGSKPPLGKKSYNISSEEQLIQIVSDYGATPPEVMNNEELFNFFKPILLNDFEVYDSYQITDFTKLKTPTTIFYGNQDLALANDKVLDWRTYFAPATVSFEEMAGDHFFLLHDKQAVTDKIMTVLTKGGSTND